MKVEAMLWVVILMALALAIVSRRYRKYGLAIVGLAVITVVSVIVLARRSEVPPAPSAPSVSAPRSKRIDFEQLHIDKLDKEDPLAKTRIPVPQIRFGQIIPLTGAEPGTLDSVRARLYNDSASFLTDYAYTLTVQDCVGSVCTTIYDQHGWASTAVPANQARDVVIDVRAGATRESPPIRFAGTPNILLSASDTRAYLTTSTP